MDSVTTLLVLLIVFLVLSLILLTFLLLRWNHKTTSNYLTETKEQSLAQISLLRTLVSLLSSKDPLAYQAIEAMNLATSIPSNSEPIDTEDYDENLRKIKEQLAVTLYPPGKEEADYAAIERNVLNDFV